MSALYPLTRGFAARMCREGIDASGAGGGWPPTSLLASVRKVARGTDNADMTPDEFLTHVRKDQQQYFLERLREYEAMLHMVGLLAGVVGTKEEQDRTRAAVKAAIENYLGSLEGAGWSIDNPMPVVSPGAAIIANAQDFFNYEEAADRTRMASRIQNTVELNMKLRVGQMMIDLVKSIWSALVDWWNGFWDTYESQGLIIAMNRARIDLTFLAAECAIDIGIAAATAGMGLGASAALKGLRFVGMRTSRATTRVIIKAIPKDIPNPTATRLLDVEIPDADIDPQIDRIIDEDRFGGAGEIADTDTRVTPNADTPNTTVVRGAGRNVATIDVDPDTGRPKSVSATIQDDMGGSTRGDNATEIGAMGRDGDHGGHLIAHRFMGDVPDAGIVPQAGNLNTGAWKKMENEWADWLAYGRSNQRNVEVEVNIDLDPPGAVRPNRFDVYYTVREIMPDGSKRVVQPERHASFANEAGETFDRVYFRTDPDDGSMSIR